MTTEYGTWHTWFAWHPVDTDEFGWKWLRKVERRKRWTDWRNIGMWRHEWQYRPTQKVVTP